MQTTKVQTRQTDQHLCYLLSKFQFSSQSLAEQAGLSLTLTESPKTGFLVSGPYDLGHEACAE